MLFIEYPKCSTCQKAKKFLEDHNISYTTRNIVSANPTMDELQKWASISSKELKAFFNTSGNMYKELKLKDKLPTMSETDKLKTLASHGMLVKRPILVSEDFVLVGFKPEEWEKAIRRA